ncbi:MAG: PDZ domain-containing protein [Anaerolineae bacterium]|nr:PDZ domain-containing protein [Anaerolineae bacterium]
MRRPLVIAATLSLLLLSLACAPSLGVLQQATPTLPRIERATLEARPVITVPTPTPRPALTPVSEDVLSYVEARDLALASIYERFSGSVVHIYVTGAGLAGITGTGSGWVWDRNGFIVTNNHVVEGASRVTVVFSDERQFEATIVGTDRDSDLAVIQVGADPELLVPLELGDSELVQVGQTAVAIGNPFRFEGTMTAGIVSALGRVSMQASGFSLPDLIQTDASINPGNSGGPLFDIRGRVIGVNTMIYSQTGEFSGIGFAVPVNTVKRVVPALITDGRYLHPHLGIRGWTITDALANVGNLPVSRGALIGEVTSGGPAEEAGLRGGNRSLNVPGYDDVVVVGGDIIIALDGQSITGMNDLISRLEKYSVGDVVVLTIVRGDETLDVPVELGARPTESGRMFGFRSP